MKSMIKRIVDKIFNKCFSKWWNYSSHVKNDVFYLKVLYFFAMRKSLALRTPKTYNEKLQWLKLYAYKKEYSDMVDKVKAKEFAAKVIGQQYIIPTLGVWKSADDIDFSSLPDRFVLKCNHNSGNGMYICKDKSKMNENEVREGLRKGLEEDYFLPGRDKPYRDVQRRILAEVYMEDSKTKELRDYKFFCFDGMPYCAYVATGHFEEGGSSISFYDIDWNFIDVQYANRKSVKIGKKLFSISS